MALNIKSILLVLLLVFYLYLIFNFLFARSFEGVENMDGANREAPTPEMQEKELQEKEVKEETLNVSIQ